MATPSALSIPSAALLRFLTEHLNTHSPDLASSQLSIAKELIAHCPDGTNASDKQHYQWLLLQQARWLLLTPRYWLNPARPQRWHLPPWQQTPMASREVVFSGACDMSLTPGFLSGEMAERNHITPPISARTEPSEINELHQISEEISQASALQCDVETLSQPTKRRSIDIAKDILDKLKVSLGETKLLQGLTMTGGNAATLLSMLKDTLESFEWFLHKVAAIEANIYEQQSILRANAAAGKLAYAAKHTVIKHAETNNNLAFANMLKREIAQFPEQWVPDSEESFEQALSELEEGLNTLKARMQQLAKNNSDDRHWLGFDEREAPGIASEGRSDKNTNKAIKDDQFFRQVQAQRAMRAARAAMRHRQAMLQRQKQQSQQQHDSGHGETMTPPPHTPLVSAPAVAPVASIGSLLSHDAINAMRSALKTDNHAAPVETGTQANNKQIISQKQQMMKAQQQRIVAEQMRRAGKRNQELTSDAPAPPPGAKKRDHGHGI